MSDNGLNFLLAKGRPNTGALAMLDMAGRQAPAPDPTPTPVPGQDGLPVAQPVAPATPVLAATPKNRIMLSWGPDASSLMIGLTSGPDLDDMETWQISRSAAREVLPIINALAKVIDLTGELKRALGPQAVPSKPKNAATGQVAARKPATRAKANAGRGGKNRAASPAVGQRSVARGPLGQGQAEPLVPGAEASVSQAIEQG